MSFVAKYFAPFCRTRSVIRETWLLGSSCGAAKNVCTGTCRAQTKNWLGGGPMARSLQSFNEASHGAKPRMAVKLVRGAEMRFVGIFHFSSRYGSGLGKSRRARVRTFSPSPVTD